jgi:hypothetical protein
VAGVNGFGSVVAMMWLCLPLSYFCGAAVGVGMREERPPVIRSRAHQRTPSPLHRYSEGMNPCIESPLAAANSLQELLLTSWGGVIRVFPAVPDSYPNVSFGGLLATGGVQVSAQRISGRTTMIFLNASASAEDAVNCTVQTDLARPLHSVPASIPIVDEKGRLQFTLRPGETLLLQTAGSPPPEPLRPNKGNSSEYNYWGSKSMAATGNEGQS